MAVSKQEIQVAECDAPRCTTRRFAEAPQDQPDGYKINVEVTGDRGQVLGGDTVWACRLTHVGPAVREALHSAGWRDRGDGPHLLDDSEAEDNTEDNVEDSDDHDEDDDELASNGQVADAPGALAR